MCKGVTKRTSWNRPWRNAPHPILDYYLRHLAYCAYIFLSDIYIKINK